MKERDERIAEAYALWRECHARYTESFWTPAEGDMAVVNVANFVADVDDIQEYSRPVKVVALDASEGRATVQLEHGAISSVPLTTLRKPGAADSGADAVAGGEVAEASRLRGIPSPDEAEKSAAEVAHTSPAHQDPSGGQSPEERLNAAWRLLRPGTLFFGSIAIPSISENSDRSAYELEVLREDTAADGTRRLVGRHAAYGDSQVCDLDLSINGAGEVALQYADMETICSCVVDVATGRITGQVQQLIHGDDGWMHPSDDATHTLDMAVDTHVGTTAAQRVDYAQACTLLVSGIGRPTALLGLPSALALQTLMMAQIEGMQDLTPAEWETLFLHAALMAEDMCAVIRRHTKLLDELTFPSPEEKHATLERLAENGLRRNEMHATCDRAFIRARDVLTAWMRITGRRPEPFLAYTLEKIYSRLSIAYDGFHRALTSAQGRPSKATLAAWVTSGDNSPCVICMGPVEPDEVMQTLPCSHVFHESCVSRWLHRSASCPNCRRAIVDAGQPDE